MMDHFLCYLLLKYQTQSFLQTGISLKTLEPVSGNDIRHLCVSFPQGPHFCFDHADIVNSRAVLSLNEIQHSQTQKVYVKEIMSRALTGSKQ